MRGHFTKVGIYTLVITLAAPASLAFAAGSSDATAKAKTPPATTVAAQPTTETAVTRDAASTTPSPVLAPNAIRKTLARAVATDSQGMPVQPRPASTKIRAQYGGGKGQMITMLVSTVVGLAATVYMLRYFQDAQKQAEEAANPGRRR